MYAIPIGFYTSPPLYIYGHMNYIENIGIYKIYIGHQKKKCGKDISRQLHDENDEKTQKFPLELKLHHISRLK